jgi:hypothetical protein
MIDVKIPTQGFELIRDQISSVLMNEFQNQVNVFENVNCMGVNFFAERNTPMDKTEQDFINISLFKGDYSNKEPDYVDGVYQYMIDVVTGGKARPGKSGDTLSNFRLQKIIGTIRYILESSVYNTLLFEPPFIAHTELSKFQIYKPDSTAGDAANIAIGQAVFTVRCGEFTEALTKNLIEGSDTSVFLELTNKGYQYAFISAGPTPPPDTRYVTIIDQYDNVLARLQGGDTYEVNVIKNIIDEIFNNQVNITDNILP